MSDQNTLRHKDPRQQQGFTTIYSDILKEGRLTTGARCLYAILKSYAWFGKDNAFPGQDRLAQDLGKSDRAVRDYLDELECSGMIEVTQRGLGQSNIYLLTDEFDAVRWAVWNTERKIKAERKKSSIPDRKNSATLDRKNSSYETDEVKTEKIKHIFSENENSNTHQHLDETDSDAILPVLLTQTGDDIEHEDFTFIAETNNTPQHAVDQMSSGIESDLSDQPKELNTATPPKRGPGRPRKDVAQAAMPLGRTTTNGEAAKPRKRSATQIAHMALLEAIEIEQKWKFNKATEGAAHAAAKILLDGGATAEDIHNIYRSLKKTAYWKDIPLSLMSIAKKYPEWVAAGKPMNGAARYTNSANTLEVIQKPAPVVNVVMASEEFF